MIAFLAVFAVGQGQETLTGPVTHVRDCDTIEVADVPISLNGVAAPELDERFGREAKEFMVRLVDGERVRCELNGERSYDRQIGICYLDDQDIGRPSSPLGWRETVRGIRAGDTSGSTLTHRGGCRCRAIAGEIREPMRRPV